MNDTSKARAVTGGWDLDLIRRVGRVLVVCWRITMIALLLWIALLLTEIKRSHYTGPSREDELAVQYQSEQLAKIREQLREIERNTRR